jgi:hypothetical protein
MSMKLDEETKSRVKYIFDTLDKNGCTKLSLWFDGSGDDGRMEYSDYKCEKDKEKLVDAALDEPTIFDDHNRDNSLLELIYQTSENLLGYMDIDYVNGNGNRGMIYFDIKKRNIRVTYEIVEEAEEVLDEVLK